MGVRKYRICLVLVLVAVLIFGAFLYVQTAKKENSYTDGILVKNECLQNFEEECA